MKNNILILATIFALYNCTPETKPKAVLTIYSNNTGDGTTKLLQARLENRKFLTVQNDTFTVDNFKFYISNIKLSNNTSTYSIPNSYCLFGYSSGEELRPNGVSITGIPDGVYTKISFAIGVDAEANASTAKRGDLDPNNNMAWNWDTGYKFVLLEGRYLNITTAGVVLHIGKNENYKELTYDLSTNLVIEDGKTPKITLLANVRNLFAGESDIAISNTKSVMGGSLAKKIANNYALGLLKIEKVEN